MAENGPGGRRFTLWRTGLQRESVQLAAHFAFERVIDDLVLLHPRLAAKLSAMTVAA